MSDRTESVRISTLPPDIPGFHVGRAPPRREGMVRIVAVGDTLGIDPRLPPCDILIHTGNFTSRTSTGIEKFARYLRGVSGHKVLVSGRNEAALSEAGLARVDGAMCLEGTTTLLCGLRITSATMFCSLKPWNSEQAVTDVVVSAIPPYGILDVDENGRHIGSAELRYLLERRPPRVVIFGGNPCGHGAMWLGSGVDRTLCVNAGIWGSSRSPLTRYGVPLIIDLAPIR